MWYHRQLLQVDTNISTNFTNYDPEYDPPFPPDLFTMNQLKSGAVLFYIIGTLKQNFFNYLVLLIH